MESNLQKNQPKDDIEKIEALLNLPRNPSSTDKQDKDWKCSGPEIHWRVEGSYVAMPIECQ